MGLQLVLRSAPLRKIQEALGPIAGECELFQISSSEVGVSIPTKVLDQIGEEKIKKVLASFNVYDLWTGTSIEPEKKKPRWKFW